MNPLPAEQLRETLSDPKLQLAIYDATGRLMQKRKTSIQPEVIDDFQQYRDQANRIKKHTIENLDYYLEQLERNLIARGGRVLWAADAEDAKRQILELARQKGVRKIVKSKSMTTEEIDLNESLEHAHIEVVETDLGEYIIQLAHERPYHIVAPALHKTRYQVADLFTEKLGVEREEVIEKQTMIARRVLREKFLAGEMGMTGANFLIADSGAVVVIENEGNARLSSSAPRIQVAVAGIEKLIPRAQDLATFLKVLGRSATGQPLTVYTSFLSGPRRPGEIDGPEEFYLVLIDNGRTRVLADKDKRQSLYCIRCGACLNHCPVYRKIGGHNYPWVYSGPIGAILSPQFHGVAKDPWLPYASSLCGACAEVCPVKIEIPKILLELRREVTEEKTRQGKTGFEKLAFRIWSWVMCRPSLYEFGASAGGALFGGATEWLKKSPLPIKVPPLENWLAHRDLPPPPPRSFRQLWRERQALRDRTGGAPGKDQLH
ncbi:MAG: iron-sulfur cluster-binding protein [Bryobacterales bacterium]|nr:iron-sulfur cluster-binding protein [Bryobacterales bacterium]